ncbi:MAG: ligase-associated DNA damage response DEXH box helicase [Planctomycetota bacterium]
MGKASAGVASAADLRAWFASRGWTPYPFQERAWALYGEGRSGLVHVPTGAGKTYAAYGGALIELIAEAGGIGERVGKAEAEEVEKVGRSLARASGSSNAEKRTRASSRALKGLRLLYITPLRAVSRDVELALKRPLGEMGLLDERVTVESRTGDTSASVRARQQKRLPNVLVTTPESLSLLLTRQNAAELLGSCRCVVVDEWHELLASKRGTQVELALARLRRLAPGVRTWALSATLSNLEDAAQAVVGGGGQAEIVTAEIDRPVVIETVLPKPGDPFPWAGHLGLTMLPGVLETIEEDGDGVPAKSTLVFVNTRSQAERWFNAISVAKPGWEKAIALHHGSLAREERERVEAGLKDGSVRLVVATSSLDLGVDFAPVERVMQVGSPKGIARLMQRAGRSGHRPGATAYIVCVPTHALEMVEVAAVRRSIEAGKIEPRTTESRPLDVLSQHLVTLGLGGGFEPDAVYDEVRTAWAYRDLSRDEFDWALDLVVNGGETLKAYPEYKKVVVGEDGWHAVTDKRIAQLHRMNVGTITGDAVMDLRFMNGKKIGFVEEHFIDQLRPGQKFVFAGRVLSYLKTHDLTAFVKPATGLTNHTPIWGGTRLPISESLGEAVRSTLEAARGAHERGDTDGLEPELQAAARLVGMQAKLSIVPGAHETLCEICDTREGTHLFLFPFDGRLVHGGLGALLALRLSRLESATFSIAANDYGVELLTHKGYPFEDLLSPGLFSHERLTEDAVESVNLSALARAQFREVARVSGLIFQSIPGAKRGVKSLQAKAGLIYEVFEQFDPGNLLLEQARREVLEKRFETSRMGRTLTRLESGPIVVKRTARPTPLSLPLVIERVGGKLSSESLAERIDRMKAAWD